MSSERTLQTDTAAFLSKFTKRWHENVEVDFNKHELLLLVEDTIRSFKNQPILAKISPPVIVVGGVHGQYSDLISIINLRYQGYIKHRFVFLESSSKGVQINSSFVFLGDYVDRGLNSITCVALLFALHLHFPSQYILLRGKNETERIKENCIVRQELIRKIGELDGDAVWEKIQEAFANMPLACLVGGTILTVNGGISQKLVNWKSFDNIERPLFDLSVNELAQDLVWAAPAAETVDTLSIKPKWTKDKTCGFSRTFNSRCIEDFCRAFNVHLIIRAHKMIEDGFQFSSNKKVLSIFSAPTINEINYRGAIICIRENGDYGIIGLKNAKAGKKRLNDELIRADDIPDVSASKESVL